jgi:hypothetical protein
VIAGIEDAAVIGRILTHLERVQAGSIGNAMGGHVAHRARGRPGRGCWRWSERDDGEGYAGQLRTGGLR